MFFLLLFFVLLFVFAAIAFFSLRNKDKCEKEDFVHKIMQIEDVYRGPYKNEYDLKRKCVLQLQNELVKSDALQIEKSDDGVKVSLIVVGIEKINMGCKTKKTI